MNTTAITKQATIDSESAFSKSSKNIKSTNIEDEEAQLIISAMTELQSTFLNENFSVNDSEAEKRKCVDEQQLKKNCFLKRAELNNVINNQQNETVSVKKRSNKNYHYPISSLNFKESDLDLKLENFSFYIDEEIILDVKEYSTNEVEEKVCNLCFDKINNKIIMHLSEHKLDKKCCIRCNRGFNYSIEYNQHKCEYIDYDEPIIQKINDNIYYSCRLCHSDDDSMDCNKNEHFSTYDLYKQHISSKHEFDIYCMVCDSKLNSPRLYLHHLKCVHSLANISCNCEMCCEK